MFTGKNRFDAPARGVFSVRAVLALAGALSVMWSPAGAQAEPPVLFRAFGTSVPAEARAYPVPEGLTEKPADKGDARWVINRTLPAEAARFGKLGYVPYVPSFMDLVFRDSAPRADQLSDTLSLRATPGELKTGAVAIHALVGLEGVEVTAGDLRAAGGDAVIAAENIDIRSTFHMRRLRGRKHFVVWPLVLEKRKDLDLPKGLSQMYYVTVAVPADAPAGVYTAQVRLAVKNRPPHEIRLELTVLPFTLAEAETTYAFWYSTIHVADSDVLKDLVAMHGCGMNSVMLVQGPNVEVLRDGEKVRFDFTKLIGFMDRYLRAGFTKPLIYNVVLDNLLNLTDDQYTDFVHQMKALARKRGWPGFIWSVGDENDARPAKYLARARRVLARTNKAAPEDLTKNTMIIPAKSEVYGTELDIRVWGHLFSEDVIRSTRKAGAQLGMYNGTWKWALDARDDRYFFGLWTWQTGLGHVEQWVYSSTYFDAKQPFNDLVNPASGASNSYFYCYPGKDGPLPTVGYYGTTEGVNDARYFRTLELCADKAETSDKPLARNLAEQASRFLADWRSQIDLSPRADGKAPATIRREVEKISLGQYDEFRRAIADFIIRLTLAMES